MPRGPRAHDLDATESNAFDSQLTQASISSTAGVGGNRRRSSTADSTSSAAERADRVFLYKRLVVDAEAKWNMHQLAISGRQFNNEHSPYYSATHKLHGMKVEVSVLPNGLAIHATKAYKGGVPDVNIFRENLEVHLTMLSKQPQDLNSPDEGPLREAYPSQWAVLADKGYQGLHQNVRAITPHKNPPRGSLSLEQQRENECISSDRVLVENYFGRMKSLWAIVGNKFRWTRTKLDMIVQLCVAFTNWHVRFHPLANADGEWHWQNERRLVAIGNAVKAKKLERQKRYREKRANRINRMLRSVDTLHSSDDDIDDDECSNQESFYETFDYA